MSEAISIPLPTVPVPLTAPLKEMKTLWNGRSVEKQRPSDASLWDKICRLFQRFSAWIKEVFSSEPKAKSPQRKKPLPPLPAIELYRARSEMACLTKSAPQICSSKAAPKQAMLKTWPMQAATKVGMSAQSNMPFLNAYGITPPNLSYLRKRDPAYNLQRISEIGHANAPESVCTEEIFKTLPKTNPMRLGYEDAEDYRTVLGDRAIAAGIGAAATAALGLSLGGIATCALTGRQTKPSHCVEAQEQFLRETSTQTLLAGGALLLAAGLYAHRQGWLGALLHDRSLGWRSREIGKLFKEAARSLDEMRLADPEKAKKLAGRILENRDLIQATLRVELRLSEERSKAAFEPLKNACQIATEEEKP